MPTPPEVFVADLRRFDPLLRVRWASTKRRWAIERRAKAVDAWLSPKPFRNYDDYRCAVDGYIHVCSVPPWQLDQRVFYALAKTDLFRCGGAVRYAQILEDMEEDEERKWDHWASDILQGISGEAYEKLAWREGRRVVSSGVPTAESKPSVASAVSG